MLRNNLMLPTEALDIPEAIDFDGTNDYVGTAGALSSSINSATFTFSAFVYDPVGAGGSVYYAGIGRFHISAGGGMLTITGVNSSGTTILSVTVATNAISESTFAHILVSVDLANSANRRLYINDRLISTPWTTYTNGSINFANAAPNYVGTGSSVFKGRLAHVYLDYTYRDLSIESNRRLFITADRKPAANQQALNPILYLPLNDPTQPGKNLGTGGDFNLTGVVARSGRGPNQYNVPYSTLNGTSQYLSATSVTGIADSKTITFHCVINPVSISGNAFFTLGVIGSSTLFYIDISSGKLQIVGSVLSAISTNAVFTANRNYVIDVSIDMADTSKRFVYVNNQSVAMTWTTYTNAVLDLTPASSPTFRVGVYSHVTAGYYSGRIGALWFNTSYIDLSVQANREKFVTGTGIDAKPVDLGANGELPTGTSPLIYLPMYGNNAGKNYGTGGDFSTSNGPFPGARGPNEFWGNVLQFAGAYSYRTSALTGAIDSKTFTFVGWFSAQASTTVTTAIDFYSTNSGLRIGMNNGGPLSISGTNIYATVNSPNPAIYANGIGRNSMYCIMISVDLTDTTKRNVYINGISQSTTWTTYNNQNLNLSSSRPTVGAYWNGSSYPEVSTKRLGELYFSVDYVDFSVEANRLKFMDAFSNPVDLTTQITAGSIPTPMIYMRFDPNNKGKNYGSGGDFTTSGTINDFGQI